MTVAVVGGRGVGRSTVAYNLGAALDAVVVDADLGLADLAAGRGPDLLDVLAGRAAPVESVRGGPVALLSCGRPLDSDADPRRFGEVLAAVDVACGGVVIDCPAASGAGVGLPLQVADCCVPVATPDPTALAAAARAGTRARRRDAAPAGTVLNRARPAACRPTVADRPDEPVVSVPESPALARSMRSGLPVAALDSGSPVAGAFDDLAAVVQQSCRS